MNLSRLQHVSRTACADDIHPPTSGLLKRLSTKCVEEKKVHMWFKCVYTHVKQRMIILKVSFINNTQSFKVTLTPHDLTGKMYGYTMLFFSFF